MSVKFDMEQQILQCWAITDEIDLFLWAKDRGMTEDQEQNHLIGLKQLYHVKFEKLWQLYEDLLQEERQAKSSLVPSKVNLPEA